MNNPEILDGQAAAMHPGMAVSYASARCMEMLLARQEMNNEIVVYGESRMGHRDPRLVEKMSAAAAILAAGMTLRAPNSVSREYASFSLTFMNAGKPIALSFGIHPTYSDLICSLTNNIRINFCDFDLKKKIPMGKSMMNDTELLLVGINFFKKDYVESTDSKS